MGTVLFWTLIIGLVYAIFKYPFVGGIVALVIFVAVILLKIFLPKDKWNCYMKSGIVFAKSINNAFNVALKSR